jgi:hypothetical protein
VMLFPKRDKYLRIEKIVSKVRFSVKILFLMPRRSLLLGFCLISETERRRPPPGWRDLRRGQWPSNIERGGWLMPAASILLSPMYAGERCPRVPMLRQVATESSHGLTCH